MNNYKQNMFQILSDYFKYSYIFVITVYLMTKLKAQFGTRVNTS